MKYLLMIILSLAFVGCANPFYQQAGLRIGAGLTQMAAGSIYEDITGDPSLTEAFYRQHNIDIDKNGCNWYAFIPGGKAKFENCIAENKRKRLEKEKAKFAQNES